MSDFQLDVDSPYPRPSREDLTITPRKMAYTQSRITHKHYGKYVAQMLRKVREEGKDFDTTDTIDAIARYMRSKSFEYNQEHPNNEVIIKDIKQLSGGDIEIDEIALNNLRSDYKQHFSARPQKGQQRPQQKGMMRSGGAKMYNNPKNKNNNGMRKNGADNASRYNSQK